MAKRHIDTEIFDDPWFTELTIEGKVFFVYYFTNCDHAGVLVWNEKIACTKTGIPQEKIERVKQELGNRLVSLNSGKYFMPKFFTFQYPKFPTKTWKAAESAFEIIKNLNLIQHLPQTLQEVLYKTYGNGNGNGNGKKGESEGDTMNIELAREFYREEFTSGKGKDHYMGYCRFVGIIFNEKFPNPLGRPVAHILSMPSQLSFEEYVELLGDAKPRGVHLLDLLNDMINKPKYTEGAQSLYLTLKSWINKRELHITNA